ncbi:hypothetical protein AAG570_012982 [Ranatra chinensis]|uniref:DUF1736 domain-containing protein n=1 Tax=Ranatra chinensis TaxID=642074 RepID=A0ABD0YHB2_9HEMI
MSFSRRKLTSSGGSPVPQVHKEWALLNEEITRSTSFMGWLEENMEHTRRLGLMTFFYLAAFNWWLIVCPSTLSHDWQMGSVPLVASLADSRNLATCVFFGCCLIIAYRCIADFEAFSNARLPYYIDVLRWIVCKNSAKSGGVLGLSRRSLIG